MSQTSVRESYQSIFEAEPDREAQAVLFADEVKVFVLRNITVEGVDTLLRYHLHARQVRARVEFGGYGSMLQDTLDPAGAMAQFQPDIIVVCLSLEELDSTFGAPGWSAESVRAELEALFEALSRQGRATVVLHTFLRPLYSELGLIASQGSDLTAQIDSLNRFVAEFVRRGSPRFVLADWGQFLHRLGADAALDGRARYLWRAPFRRPFLDEQARHLARIASALKGKTKKVLVLDCDNTLWGGVVGEEGIDGIDLDPNQHPGRAFYDFHAAVLHLAERGVLIALCSKNEEADVFEVLDKHPSCRIKRSHLAAWRINWTDKATNIRDMADELNLGLDAFVFVDDSSVECDLVRKLLPQVTVLQVPTRAHELPTLVLKDGWFDTLAVTEEDKLRARMYQGEAQRKSNRASFANLDEYLASLETVARFSRDDPRDIPRIAQLTQKTNQFNLTTRRYSEPEIAEMVGSREWAVFGLSADDRFGTLGLVGVLIVRLEDDIGRIDTLLMSCRALGRRLEDALVEVCLAALSRERSIAQWEAEYLPTRKNAQVASFWDRLGFERMSDGESRHHYRRSSASPLPVSIGHISIDRSAW